jgi:hypothetical protein
MQARNVQKKQSLLNKFLRDTNITSTINAFKSKLANTSLNPFTAITPLISQDSEKRFSQTYSVFAGRSGARIWNGKQGIFSYIIGLPLNFISALLVKILPGMLQFPFSALYDFVTSRKNLGARFVAGLLLSPFLLASGIVSLVGKLEGFVAGKVFPWIDKAAQKLIIPLLSVVATMVVSPFVLLTHIIVNSLHKKDLPSKKPKPIVSNDTTTSIHRGMGSTPENKRPFSRHEESNSRQVQVESLVEKSAQLNEGAQNFLEAAKALNNPRR